MIKAIILDIDNTIIYTKGLAAKTHRQTAKELGLRVPPIDEIREYSGIPFKKFCPKLWPQADCDKFWNISKKKILSVKLKAVPYAFSTLKKLHKKYPLGLISSKAKVLMGPHIKQTKLPVNIFKFIYSGDDVKYPKPDPRVFTKALKHFKILKRSEILYVGDSTHDYEAAHTAGLKFVAVLTGYHKKKDFQKLGLKNKNILKSVKFLPKWLDENNK